MLIMLFGLVPLFDDRRQQLEVSDEARWLRLEIRCGKRPLNLPSADVLRCTTWEAGRGDAPSYVAGVDVLNLEPVQPAGASILRRPSTGASQSQATGDLRPTASSWEVGTSDRLPPKLTRGGPPGSYHFASASTGRRRVHDGCLLPPTTSLALTCSASTRIDLLIIGIAAVPCLPCSILRN